MTAWLIRKLCGWCKELRGHLLTTAIAKKCNCLYYISQSSFQLIKSIHGSITCLYCSPISLYSFESLFNDPGFGADLLRLKPVGICWFGNLSITSVFFHSPTWVPGQEEENIKTPSRLLYLRIIQIPPPSPLPRLKTLHCRIAIAQHNFTKHLLLTCLPLVPNSSIFIHHGRFIAFCPTLFFLFCLP